MANGHYQMKRLLTRFSKDEESGLISSRIVWILGNQESGSVYLPCQRNRRSAEAAETRGGSFREPPLCFVLLLEKFA